MQKADKVDFCRSLATLRAMYPNEFNMSELVPVAYWTACRELSLFSVKQAILRLIRMPEWSRQMPPAPVLAEQARVIERQRNRRPSTDTYRDNQPPRHTAESEAWVHSAKKLTEVYIREGMACGPATLRAVGEMLARGR